MKIILKKTLDYDIYDSISIHDDKIIVINQSPVISKEPPNKLSNLIKGKSNYQIIMMIVDHFLKNGEVCYVASKEAIKTDGRKIKFDSSYDKYILERILKSYELSRESHMIASTECEHFISAFDMTSYYTKDNHYLLATKDGKIIENELDFFRRMIDKTFENEKAYLVNENNNIRIISLTNPNKIFILSNLLMKYYSLEVCNIISNHNNGIQKEKGLRLEDKNGK